MPANYDDPLTVYDGLNPLPRLVGLLAAAFNLPHSPGFVADRLSTLSAWSKSGMRFSASEVAAAFECLEGIGVAIDDDRRFYLTPSALRELSRRTQAPLPAELGSFLQMRDGRDRPLQECLLLSLEPEMRPLMERLRRRGHRSGFTTYHYNDRFKRHDYERFAIWLRLAFHVRRDFAQVESVYNDLCNAWTREYSYSSDYRLSPLEVLLKPLSLGDLELLPDPFLGGFIARWLLDYCQNLKDPSTLLGWTAWLREHGKAADFMETINSREAQIRLLRGEFELAAAIYPGPLVEGAVAFIRHDVEKALAIFEAACQGLARDDRQKQAIPDGIFGVFYALSAYLSTDAKVRGRLGRRCVYAKKVAGGLAEFYDHLLQTLRCEAGKASGKEVSPSCFVNKPRSCFYGSASSLFFMTVVSVWKRGMVHPDVNEQGPRWRAHGYQWLADEAAAMAAGEYGHSALCSLLLPPPLWQEQLATLMAAVAPSAVAGVGAAADVRLAWIVRKRSFEKLPFLIPMEQRRLKSGAYSVGHVISLRNFLPEITYKGPLTEADRRILDQAQRSDECQYYYHEGLSSDIWPAVVGHPLVFLEADGMHLEVVAGTLQLAVVRDGAGYQVKATLAEMRDDEVMLEFQGRRLVVTSFTAAQQKILDCLEKPIAVPAEGVELLKSAIGNVAIHATVHSDLAVEPRDVAVVPADPQVHFRVVPTADGFAVDAVVHPFGLDGPAFVPGEGMEVLFTTRAEGAVTTRRHLMDERNHLGGILGACPLLAGTQTAPAHYLWPDPETALQALAELKELPAISILWPEGETLKLRGTASHKSMGVKVKPASVWFEASGSLQVDEGLTLSLQELLRLNATRSGQFVKLSDGSYLELTRQLQKTLDLLSAFTDDKFESVRIHKLAAATLASELGIAKSKEWTLNRKTLETAFALVPAVPKTFQAELRNYQQDGFVWLSRLAAWGVGACLADDMGLGKTIQALALILDRADRGPALVVAPTSVCSNWLHEIRRFAPTLNPILLREADRESVFEALRPGDLLIVSYGLLINDIEDLEKIDFGTIVLDEAKSIKNAQSKRFKAACRLNGQFRMVATGTPVENHIEELWSLFQFINPGFLGGLEQFRSRFILAENSPAATAARQRLRRLASPFILRRRKSEILDELPPKTEITLSIELAPETAAFYEALRRTAVQDLAGQTELKPIAILAHLTRLRRACCHPSLVDANANLPSAKLEALLELVEELMDNGHQALVFSQFVGHLAFVRQALDERKIAYRYLDGQTPPKVRDQEVAAFQKGKASLFLISLKAGGTGLNLTAADYVIHLDPWWNPAVEDQASDRAHRIGQARPVTIYRLVTKDTIEEKILALHSTKRDLAESILQDTDQSFRLDAKQLMALLQP
jgi:superfamily II DNA or RNA helicase